MKYEIWGRGMQNTRIKWQSRQTNSIGWVRLIKRYVQFRSNKLISHINEVVRAVPTLSSFIKECIERNCSTGESHLHRLQQQTLAPAHPFAGKTSLITKPITRSYSKEIVLTRREAISHAGYPFSFVISRDDRRGFAFDAARRDVSRRFCSINDLRLVFFSIRHSTRAVSRRSFSVHTLFARDRLLTPPRGSLSTKLKFA